jgi:hypothetical protein
VASHEDSQFVQLNDAPAGRSNVSARQSTGRLFQVLDHVRTNDQVVPAYPQVVLFEINGRNVAPASLE